MDAHKIASHIGIFLLAGLFLAPAVLLLRETAAAWGEASPFLSAPLISSEEDLDGKDGIVLLKGRLAAAEEALPRAPLSGKACLYYDSGKWLGSWDTNSDGDSVRVWTEVEREIKAPPLAFLVGRREVPLEGGHITYFNLEKSADYERTIDGDDYSFREDIIPLENSAWAAGRLENGRLREAERGILLSLSSGDALVRRLKGAAAVFFYFSVLLGVTGLGFLSGLVVRLLPGGSSRTSGIVYGFLNAGYLWLMCGIVFAAIDVKAPWIAVIGGIIITAGVLTPLLLASGGKVRAASLMGTTAALGLITAAAFLFEAAYISLAPRPLETAGGITLLLAALALLNIYSFLSRRAG